MSVDINFSSIDITRFAVTSECMPDCMLGEPVLYRLVALQPLLLQINRSMNYRYSVFLLLMDIILWFQHVSGRRSLTGIC